MKVARFKLQLTRLTPNPMRTTILHTCERALKKEGYMVFSDVVADGWYTRRPLGWNEDCLIIEKEDIPIVCEKKKEEKMECEIWLHSPDYIEGAKATDWKDLQKLLSRGYHISSIVKTKTEVDSYQYRKR